MEKERISSYCLDCIMRRQEKLIRSVADEQLQREYRKAVEQTAAQRGPTDSAPVLVARLNRIQEKFLGVTDIYGPIKEKYNRIMMELSDEIRKKIRNSEDPLAQALVFARAGNFIDFGAMHDVDDEIMHQLLEEAPKLKPSRNAYQAFRQDLHSARHLVYLTDNCGEIVLDRLLIEQIHEEYPAVEITVIVRGMPVINDATMEDARMAGLTDMAGIRVIDNGTAVAGTELSLISEQAADKMNCADVIISKGQGNFETLHGCGMNIYYLFLCKCDWFSMNLDLPGLSGVFENERDLIKRWKAAQDAQGERESEVVFCREV